GSTSPRSGTREDAVEHGSRAEDSQDDEDVPGRAASVTVTVGDAGSDGFYVADDGPGIPESERDAVFEGGYTTAEDGTGFGLAIVEDIVEAHGWTVDVTASEDGGARFDVRGVTTADPSPSPPA
ncbi:MAG: sensor histidine kinase, partial [Halobacterium sp.]